MEKLLEYICDEVCKYPNIAKTQEELISICVNCRCYELADNVITEAFCRGTLVGAKTGEKK